MTYLNQKPHGIAGLFYGYGGLDLAVQAVLGEPLVWLAEYDGLPTPRKPWLSGAAAIAAHHHPEVLNVGDVTTTDWRSLPRPLVKTGGSPCQDLSGAGRRAGMTTGTRSNLWVAMREAIAVQRPPLVVWENVRGAYSASADSAVVLGGRLLGPRDGGPALRALGRVLGDLSDLGYDTVWHGLRAADIGAPHGRLRVFVVALDRTQAHLVPALTPRGGPAAGQPAVALLPTPAVNDMGEGKTPETWDAWTDRMRVAHGNGNGHGDSLAIEAQRLLPTPNASEGRKGEMSTTAEQRTAGNHQVYIANALATQRLLQTPSTADGLGGHLTRGNARSDELLLPGEAASMDGRHWGPYAAAIHRWEHLTRPAPDPTMLSRTGTAQLSPAFVEWMMGLPAGHVTDVPGTTRSDQLRALGNGVVPQQAEAALRYALPILLATR